MEFAVARRRGKKRSRKKRRSKKRRREREVRLTMRHRMLFPECVTDARETLATGTMQADAFWKNYAAAQEWQKRHSITWWRSRCVALEHENKLLRDKVRSLTRRRRGERRDAREDDYHAEDENGDAEASSEDLEFNVTEDMLNFFETSERHRREMRRKRGDTAQKAKNSEEVPPIVSATECARMRKEEADLLYGDAGSKILAMETALQNMIKENTVNPQYWPNIPFKP